MYTITNDANEPLFNTDRFDTAMGWFMDRMVITTTYQRRMVAERLCATGGHTNIAQGYKLHYAPN